jgi:hypothetical protein
MSKTFESNDGAVEAVEIRNAAVAVSKTIPERPQTNNKNE